MGVVSPEMVCHSCLGLSKIPFIRSTIFIVFPSSFSSKVSTGNPPLFSSPNHWRGLLPINLYIYLSQNGLFVYYKVARCQNKREQVTNLLPHPGTFKNKKPPPLG